MTNQREAFEKYLMSNGWYSPCELVYSELDKTYKMLHINNLWEWWQEATKQERKRSE